MSRMHLATQHPIRMGAVSGVHQYFKGRVTCLQIYGMMMNSNQIATIKKKCAARDRKWPSANISMQSMYLTIIPQARVRSEMLDSQRGGKRRVGYNQLLFNKREWNNCFLLTAPKT